MLALLSLLNFYRSLSWNGLFQIHCPCSLSCLPFLPLIEFQTYPIRCSCFLTSYLMSVSLTSLVPHSLQICSHRQLAISFQHSAISLPVWRNPSHSVSILWVGQNTQCRWLLLFHPLPQLFRLPAPLFLTFTTHCWLLPRRSFPFPQFNSGLFTCSSPARFSSSRLLVNKAVRGVKHLIAR